MSRGLCILGMMRTGTSAVAGVLHLLGVHFGPEERLLQPNVANPSGFWEHRDVIALNDELLARLGGSWHAPPVQTPAWHESPALGDLRRRGQELVERDLASASVWAWKDPRTCLTLPFWEALVPSASPVICVRAPDATARSFSTMGWAAVDRLQHPYATGLDLWLGYTTAALEGTQERERLVVFYGDLVAEPGRQAERLAAFAGISERLTRPARQAIGEFLRAPSPRSRRRTDRSKRPEHPAHAEFARIERNFRRELSSSTGVH